jgi:vanillate O-demethylase monooxygenase subunit
VAFVHHDTLAMVAGDAWASNRPKLTTHERGISYKRWFENSPPPMGVSDPEVDIWQVHEYLAPGLLIMPMTFYPKGTAARFDRDVPSVEAEPLLDIYNFQAVTPVAARRTRYFFAVGVGRYGGAEVLEALYQLTIAAFDQDKEMISAQQDIIDRTSTQKMGPTVHDRAPNHLRMTIDKMLRAEQTA